jgi:hypothetical protein
VKEKPGTVIPVFSDTQIGGSTALCLPQWQIRGAKPDETMPFEASLASKWLYEKWVDYWEYIKFLAGVQGKHRKHRILSIHGGDILEGVHHGSLQSLQDVGDQIEMASNIMTTVANLSDGGVYGAMGTEAHAGPGWCYERQIAKNAGFRAYEPELHLDIDGLIVWCYHHGRAGKRDHTSAAAGVAVDARLMALETGEPAPRYVFTAHNHVIDDSGEKLLTRAMTLPSWQLKTAFGFRVASGKRSDIGGVIILPNGELDTSRMRYYAAPGQTRLVKA